MEGLNIYKKKTRDWI